MFSSSLSHNKTNQNKNSNALTKPSSSVYLQIILYFDKIFSALYIFCVMLLFIYKGYVLPYPPGSLGPEIVATIYFLIIQFIRLSLASEGNKTETLMYLIYSLVLTIPVAVGYAYFFRLQTYVIVIDMCFNIIGLAFLAVEIILGIVACCRINKD